MQIPESFGNELQKMAFFGILSEAPKKYVREVSEASGIPEEHAKIYVRNIRPHRFAIPAKQFAAELKPVYDIKERQYNPLQKGLTATAPGSSEEKAYMAQHGKKMDKLFMDWTRGQAAMRRRYTGGDTMGPWASAQRRFEQQEGPDWYKLKTAHLSSFSDELQKIARRRKKFNASKVLPILTLAGFGAGTLAGAATMHKLPKAHRVKHLANTMALGTSIGWTPDVIYSGIKSARGRR